MKISAFRKKALLCLILLPILIALGGCTQVQGVAVTGFSVWGEHLRLQSEDGILTQYTLREIRDEQQPVSVLAGEAANSGLALWQLLAGSYEIRIPDEQLPLLAEADFSALEGYTLPREGDRVHWRFHRNRDGRLLLTCETVQELPKGYCDVFLDVGHGGNDPGATNGAVLEADENLRTAQCFAEYLQAMGLTVMLSRESNAIGGGVAAEDNPYVTGARIELSYRNHCTYFISNHLNADNGRERGYQIYCSVQGNTDWGSCISQRWQELGLTGNENGWGSMGGGLYQRWLEDDAEPTRDHYFVLRETGGVLTRPYVFPLVQRWDTPDLRWGAEAILLEYAFLDNDADLRWWQENYRSQIEQAAEGCADYWQLEAE